MEEEEINSTKQTNESDYVENVYDEEYVDDEGGNENEMGKKFQEPTVDMSFETMDELVQYYISYGLQEGFGVSKRSSVRDIDSGKVKYLIIACNRYGTRKSTTKNILKPRANTKIGCLAKINGRLMDDGKWHITGVELNHNHLLSPGKSRFYRCHRKIRPNVKRRLEINDRAGIRMNKSFNSFVVEAGGYEHLTFTEKDCRNLIDQVRRLNLQDGDANALQSYFTKVQATDSDFFYTMELDEENRLRNLFWADGRCRAAYEDFGDAITFDTTYLTNKYDMPFAPFVGVNHHGQSILLGCGLISNEDTETFTWLFKSWLTCMSDQAPNAIITDQNRAMQNAIQLVFPNARHRWCLWHLMKKLPEKLRGYNQYESIKFSIQNVVYDSLTSDDFERRWNEVIIKYDLEKNDWLIGLYSERSRWVPCFVKNTFWAGMSTTQRSESMHAFFDGYVNSKTTLKQFVLQYENALRNKAEKEKSEDFNCFKLKFPIISRYGGMEEQLHKVYTIAKFQEFMEELTGKMYCEIGPFESYGAILEYPVTEDLGFVGEIMRREKFKVILIYEEEEEDFEVKCNCCLFEFRGILCKHALAVLIKEGIFKIPEKYILRRWRGDIKRRYTKVRVTYSDWNITDEGRRYNKMCNAFFEVADLASEMEEKCNLVMDRVGDVKLELTNSQGVRGSTQHALKSTYTYWSKPMSKESENILSPLVTHAKGRPRFKRRQSKLEQIVKRKKKGKKGSYNTKSEQVHDEIGTTSKKRKKSYQNFESECVGDVIGTQESILTRECQGGGVPLSFTQQLHYVSQAGGIHKD